MIEPYHTKIVHFRIPLLKCIITQGKGLVSIVQVLSVNSYHRELEFLGQLNSIVAVLKLLHVASHLLEGFLLVHLVPVHDTRLHLVKQLQKNGALCNQLHVHAHMYSVFVCVCVCVCVCARMRACVHVLCVCMCTGCATIGKGRPSFTHNR